MIEPTISKEKEKKIELEICRIVNKNLSDYV